MIFADIHIHALSGVDDGPGTYEDMLTMLDNEYQEDVRYICFTPHYHPGYFGENKEKSQIVFEELKAAAEKKYPDMVLALGNEFRFHPRCVSWLNEGYGRTMNGTKYVLIDFMEGEEKLVIKRGLDMLLNAGYIPILAHVERYRKLLGDYEFVQKYRDKGVKMQLDAESLFRGCGFRTKKFCHGMLDKRMVDFIASDAHSHRVRVSGVKETYALIAKKYGEVYAKELCLVNAQAMIFNQPMGGNNNDGK